MNENDTSGRSGPTIGNGLATIDRDTCLQLLAQHQRSVGRLAFVDEGAPVILPVNYAMVEDRIVLRTDPGSKLDAALDAAPVAFEVDRFDERAKRGWSVLIKGRADVVRNKGQLMALQASGLEPWAEGDRSTWVIIWPTSISGRRIQRDNDYFW